MRGFVNMILSIPHYTEHSGDNSKRKCRFHPSPCHFSLYCKKFRCLPMAARARRYISQGSWALNWAWARSNDPLFNGPMFEDGPIIFLKSISLILFKYYFFPFTIALLRQHDSNCATLILIWRQVNRVKIKLCRQSWRMIKSRVTFVRKKNIYKTSDKIHLKQFEIQ